MKYHTMDELDHFRFGESVVAAVRMHPGCVYLELDNVTILPDNSCNRDIREMRANGLCLKLQEGEILSFVREAYRIYDADGNLTQAEEDVQIDVKQDAGALGNMENATVFEITRQGEIYCIELDVEEYTYRIDVQAAHDIEEWDRFLNPAEM